MNIVLWLLISVFSWTHAVEVVETEDYRQEIDGSPLDISAHRVVSAYFEFANSFYELKPVSPTERFELQEQYKLSAERLADHLSQENRVVEFAAFYEQSDEVIREALRPVVRDLIVMLNTRILAGEQTNLPTVTPRALFRSYQALAQYEYIYGQEIKREVVDKYESIIRQTFFENKTHNVDIAADFLEPIRKIISTLQLKSMFEWLWDSKLYFGYHSSFKYHRKVFIRFKGYYQKTAVTVEVLRRKKSFWGNEPWEKYGTSTKLVEEPTAIVGREVMLID